MVAMVARSPAPISSSSASRMSLSIWGLTRISIISPLRFARALEPFQASAERANFVLVLSGLFPLLGDHRFLGLGQKILIREFLLHARKLFFQLSQLLDEPGPLLRYVNQSAQREINFQRADHGRRRSFGWIGGNHLRGAHARKRPQIRFVRSNPGNVFRPAAKNHLHLF